MASHPDLGYLRETLVRLAGDGAHWISLCDNREDILEWSDGPYAIEVHCRKTMPNGFPASWQEPLDASRLVCDALRALFGQSPLRPGTYTLPECLRPAIWKGGTLTVEMDDLIKGFGFIIEATDCPETAPIPSGALNTEIPPSATPEVIDCFAGVVEPAHLADIPETGPVALPDCILEKRPDSESQPEPAPAPAPFYRLYVVVALDAVKAMKGNRGRLGTQIGHGFVHALFDALDRFPEDVRAYRTQSSAFKITLAVETGEQLQDLIERYRGVCGVSLVEERGTRGDGSVNEAVKGITALGIGPIRTDLVGEDLATLRPLL